MKCPACGGKGVITGLCECGCGRPTKIIPETNLGKGHRAGYPLRFITGHNTRKAPPTANGFWSLVDQGDGCWEWKGYVAATGYGTFYMHGRTRPAHRLAYEFAVGSIPPGLLICHHCDNRRCVRPDHLYAGTHEDNMRDMSTRGRTGTFPIEKHARGSGHGMAKLTEEMVTEIRRRFANGGITKKALGQQYGVRCETICDIVSGKSWRHVPIVSSA